jgi:galactose mutarotase-like enzyme
MNTVLIESQWHDFESLVLENDELRMVVVPETGARIVSLLDKTRGVEWLVSPQESNPTRRLDYGADFNSQTPGGWDEMFPTILAEAYPVPGAYSGVNLPDHGEVWTLAWKNAGSAGREVKLVVEGHALPYRLVRSLSFTGHRTVRFDYEAANLGDAPLWYIWAAHPQLACPTGTKIVLPDEVTQVVNVLPLEWGEQWGPAGTMNAWPVLLAQDGCAYHQDVVGAPSRKSGRKFYIPPEQHISRAGLVQPAGSSLWMEWDPVQLPYCGVWIDEGALNQVASVAIEPITGYYDSLSTAWKNQRLAKIEPGTAVSWQLSVTLK